MINEKISSGFYLCEKRAVYYNNITSISIVPAKNGKLINREYQHSEIKKIIRKLSLIDDYYLIRKEILSIFNEKDGLFDIENFYSIGKRKITDLTNSERKQFLNLKNNIFRNKKEFYKNQE